MQMYFSFHCFDSNVCSFLQYYFGDFNMMKDKFLRAEVQKNDGWIPIKTLLRFNRLAALTKDESVVLSAFKDNPSELVMVCKLHNLGRWHFSGFNDLFFSG